MNAANLNDYIEIMAKSAEDRIKGHEVIDILRKLKTSAMFHMDMSEMSPKIDDLPNEQLVCEESLLPPFPSIRLFDTRPDLNGFMHHYLFHCSENRVVVIDITQMKKIGMVVASITEGNASELVNLIRAGTPFESRGSVMILHPKFMVLPDEDTHQNIHQENVNKFCEFISLINCPRHHVCRVSKPRGEHSVQWVEARSHYIVLGPEHAKEVVAGNGVTREFSGAITRAMHNRRAHFRTLTHARYTRKRGLKIWVNASWVGPEEWKDRSGNCYKIIQEKKK